jgi:hypothetical protein
VHFRYLGITYTCIRVLVAGLLLSVVTAAVKNNNGAVLINGVKPWLDVRCG